MINLGLNRISRLLNLLAQRDRQLQYQPPWGAIHVAGTNGKGSVAAYLAALLKRTGQVRTDEDIAHVEPVVRDDSDVTASYAASKDGKGGIKVGRFTSPHFIDSWDCITINDQAVSRHAFERTNTKISQLAQQVEQQLIDESSIDDTHDQHDSHDSIQQDVPSSTAGNRPSKEQILNDARLTEFELLTATAFDIFSNPDAGPCDIAVIECGLGGRLDATNVLPTTTILVSIITRIGLDHLNMLGGNLQGIVREKCGILRREVPVVIDADNDQNVLDMIHAEITNKFGERWVKEMTHEARSHDVQELIEMANSQPESASPHNSTNNPTPQLLNLMSHQQSNLAIALKAYQILQTRPLPSNLHFEPHSSPSPSLLEAVLNDSSKSYPGRLQWFQPGWLHGPPASQFPRLNASPILLDGAHNAQSAAVLRSCVDRALSSRPPSPAPSSEPNSLRPRTIWVISLSSTKPPSEILSTLINPATDSIVFTTFSTPVAGMPWVRPTPLDTLLSAAEELELGGNVVGRVGGIGAALGVAEGLLEEWENERAVGRDGERPLVVVAGSLYLVSDFLRFLRDDARDMVS